MGRVSVYDPATLDKAQNAYNIALELLRKTGMVDCENERIKARLARLTLGILATRSPLQEVAERAVKEFSIQQQFIEARSRVRSGAEMSGAPLRR